MAEGNPAFSTRLKPAYADRIRHFAEEQGISHAEAIRRLVVAALEEDTIEVKASKGLAVAALAIFPLGLIDVRLALVAGMYATVAAIVYARNRRRDAL